MNRKAANLRGALNKFDPEKPLRGRDELDAYFVARPHSPLGELKTLLLNANKPQKILFTGHRGSGKSTELEMLAQQVSDRFFVLNYSVAEALNLADLTFEDVLLSLGLQLVLGIARDNLEVHKDAVPHFLALTRDRTVETQTGEGVRCDTGVELQAFVVKFFSRLRIEDQTRQTIREHIRPRLSDLLEAIEILSKEAERASGRPVMVVVEDLDKLDLELAQNLFYRRAPSLSAPNLTIIYTFPNALRHENEFRQVELSFPNVFILPNLKTRPRSDGAGGNERDMLAEIVTRRVEENLIEPDAIGCLLDYSSGIPRELMILARRACLDAMTRDRESIDQDAVRHAVNAIRRDYQVMLDPKQLDLLRQVRDSRQIRNDEDHRALLHNLSVLEYRNRDVWYYVHPIVGLILDDRYP